MAKIFWMVCQRCGFRYYIGSEILAMDVPQSICPKCHLEFDPRAQAAESK